MRVVCLSGGMDSTVLAYDLKKQGHELFSLAFHYGQKHYRETLAAKRIADLLGIRHQLIDFEPVVARGSSALTGGKGSPVLANRNATMLSLASTFAASRGARVVYYCPTKEDFDLFPDCRPEFVAAFNSLLQVGGVGVEVVAPYINKTKGEVAKIGKRLGVPFDITWSCYEGAREPCGKCLACITRREALQCLK